MTSLVRTETGRLAGFIRAPPNTAFVDLDGRERWATDMFPSANAASAVAFEDHVIVVAYDSASAGAELHAFDRATGAPLWMGDLRTLAVAHSAYSNDVELRLEHGALVVRGRESMQDYLELFDPKGGERLLSVLAYR
jgi:hypothetical protein